MHISWSGAGFNDVYAENADLFWVEKLASNIKWAQTLDNPQIFRYKNISFSNL